MPRTARRQPREKNSSQGEPAPHPAAGGRGKDWFWLVLILVPPILLFPKLGEIYLWQDEAETALIGRAILEHGYPLAKVGPNLVSDQPGQVDINSSGIWIWSPWLQGYVAAVSFALLGVSTLAARLPFVLAGWGALLIYYAALKNISRNRQLSRYATMFLLASVPFILHARQCRYYILLVLFSILQLWGYVRLTRRQAHGAGLFVIGGAGLFYSWYPQLAVSTLAMGAHACIFHRNAGFLRRFMLGCASIGAVCLPYFLYTQGWSRDYGGAGYNYDHFWRYLSSLRAYFLQVHVYCWPGLLAIPLLWRPYSGFFPAQRRAMRWRVTFFAALWLAAVCLPPGALGFSLMGVALIGLGADAYLHFKPGAHRCYPDMDWREELTLAALFLVIGCFLIAGLSSFPYYRYYLGLLPVFTLLTAATVLALAAGRKWVSWMLALCLLLCNLVQLGPFTIVAGAMEATGLVARNSYLNDFGYRPNNLNAVLSLRIAEPYPRFQSLAWDYAGELTHEYMGPIGGTVRYLLANSSPDENILTTYEHFPLMFYTDRKVYSPASGNIPAFPDWVLIHGKPSSVLPAELLQALRDPQRYRQVQIDAPENAWENIPEPGWHSFRTPSDASPVIMFHRLSSSR